MEQPALGQKITELRNSRRITQKELAELCKVDIRTIQRIESGEVDPRTYTINLLSEALGYDFKEYPVIEEKQVSAKSLRMAVIAGLVLSVNIVIIIVYHIQHTRWAPSVLLVLLGESSIAPVLFFNAFYRLAKQYKNRLIVTAAIGLMILMPVTNVIGLLNEGFVFRLSYQLMLVSATLFGIGVIVEGSRKSDYLKKMYLTAGVIVVAEAFIGPLTARIFADLYLSICSSLLLTAILYLEYQKITGKSWLPRRAVLA
jgi:transcriptional regulator with XRE-family HTH domain